MLTIICPHCHALHFDCEKLVSLWINLPKFSMCCLQGQIQLPPFQPLTGILHNYLTGDNYPSREFHNNICVTNFIQSYLYQFFDDFHGLKTSLKPLRRPFNRYKSRIEAINNG